MKSKTRVNQTGNAAFAIGRKSVLQSVATRLTRNNEKSRKAAPFPPRGGKKKERKERNRATSEVPTGGKTELTTRLEGIKKKEKEEKRKKNSWRRGEGDKSVFRQAKSKFLALGRARANRTKILIGGYQEGGAEEKTMPGGGRRDRRVSGERRGGFAAKLSVRFKFL